MSSITCSATSKSVRAVSSRPPKEYQRAAHMDPTEDRRPVRLGKQPRAASRAFEPATEVFSSAIARYPKSARLHVGLGIAQYS